MSFTNQRYRPIRFTGDWAQDSDLLQKYLAQFFLSLEQKDALTPGVWDVWTPAITFATPGDLAVTYSIQTGDYTRLGQLVIATFLITTSAFTHTTAAGNLHLTGLPFTAKTAANHFWGCGLSEWQGITKANFTDIGIRIASAGTFARFLANGSGQAAAFVTAADMPTAGNVALHGTLIYQV